VDASNTVGRRNKTFMTNESDPDPDPDSDSDLVPPTRRYRWRYGPLRLVTPWLCIGIGGVMMVGNLGTSTFTPGLGLVVLGIIAFFVYRWMAKRGI
jgi:hypothetical protein